MNGSLEPAASSFNTASGHLATYDHRPSVPDAPPEIRASAHGSSAKADRTSTGSRHGASICAMCSMPPARRHTSVNEGFDASPSKQWRCRYQPPGFAIEAHDLPDSCSALSGAPLAALGRVSHGGYPPAKNVRAVIVTPMAPARRTGQVKNAGRASQCARPARGGRPAGGSAGPPKLGAGDISAIKAFPQDSIPPRRPGQRLEPAPMAARKSAPQVHTGASSDSAGHQASCEICVKAKNSWEGRRIDLRSSIDPGLSPTLSAAWGSRPDVRLMTSAGQRSDMSDSSNPRAPPGVCEIHTCIGLRAKFKRIRFLQPRAWASDSEIDTAPSCDRKVKAP